ncbi:hypothetical protein VNI00_009170 [Paramarasmius palmivorus]|uniref:VPS9 domain-containing protein n=1 Tax=Paramarasmius palmivorus TaxID=297713 RepID=A0AAW0CUG4_9AGAR
MSKSSSNRESNFPATSIGRSSGAKFLSSPSHTLSRSPSNESLVTHPLLSPASSSTNVGGTAWDNGFSASTSPSTSGTSIGYVPYTPRHRPPSSHLTHTSTTTASTSPSPSVFVTPATPNVSSGSGGDASSKLQLMNLKSAAQGLGLDVGSVGWAIVERLVGIVVGEESEEDEWKEIWNALGSGKATLLLPADPLSSLGAHMSISRNDKDSMRRGNIINSLFVSPALVKNHIIYCDASSTHFMTMSGLYGTLSSEDIAQTSTRAAGFSSFPSPLPTSPTNSRYPTYALTSHTSSFTLPPRGSLANNHDPKKKPPLPPRRPPGSGATIQRPTTPSGANSSRLASLVNLFGRSNSTPSPSTTPIPLPNPENTSRPPSILSVEEGEVTPTTSALNVPAYAVSLSIHTQEALRGIWRGCIAEAKERLKTVEGELSGSSSTPIHTPQLVIDRTLDFMDQETVFPVLRIPLPGQKPKRRRRREEDDMGYRYEVNPYGGDVGSWKDVEELAATWQMFYADLEDEIRGGGPGSGKGTRDSSEVDDSETNEKESLMSASVSASVSEEGGEKEQEIQDEEAVDAEERQEREDARVRVILERVEKVLCSDNGVYGRLFPQPSPQCSPLSAEDAAEDAAHDEALASRIAALNLVDFGLADLDVDVGTRDKETQEKNLMDVVKACGQALTKLEEVYSPRDKAAVLVTAHKVLVEGLEKMPSVRLKTPDEAQAEAIAKSNKLDELAPKDEAKPIPTILDGEPVTSPTSEGEPIAPPETAAASLQPLQPSTPPPAEVDPSSQTLADPASSPETTYQQPQALSLDTIFPLLILSVVKANPPRLISHLLYTQRFRNRSFGGEEAYCLVNLMAVAEFIGALDPSTVTSTRLGIIPQLQSPGSGPIPIPAPSSRPGSRMSQSAQSTTSTSFTLRHRVEQQVDALSTSAGRVLTGVSGVVDSSFGILKNMNLTLPVSLATPEVKEAAPWNGQREVLVRRDTGGFSIRSLKLPGLGGGSGSGQGRKEEEMVSVSRPGSVRSRRSTASRIVTDSDEDEDETDSSVGTGEEEDASDDDDEDEGEEEEYVADARSIKSFESMMSSRRRETKRSAKDVAGAARKSLSDRLAKVSSGIMGNPPASGSTSMKVVSPPGSRRSSLLVNPPTNRFDSPISSPSVTTNALPLPGLRLAPPNKRLLECTDADDLRLKDVAELLKEYKRLVEGIRSVGGFDELLDS